MAADEQWRPAPGTSHGELVAQQDSAAGGRERRAVLLPDGRKAQASVILRGRTAEVRAHLRYSHNGRMREVPLGAFGGQSRDENLRLAWAKAHESGLTAS